MTVGHVVTIAGILFTLGMMGVLSRKNILIVLLSVELMLNAVALAFCAFGDMVGNFDGQITPFSRAARRGGARAPPRRPVRERHTGQAPARSC